MCGLFGMYSSVITIHEKQMFKELGIVSSLRGTDSTGVIIGSRKKKGGNKYNIDQKKDVMNPTSFLEDWHVNKAINEDNTFLLAGHCRETTAGAINFHNAHPIQHGNILLCHNGTIDKWRPTKDREDHSSDSRIFAEKISKLGVEKALWEAEDGNYAITFVDTQKRTFNIARKPGRTLYIVFSKDGEVMAWASEAEFLELVLKRHGVRHNWSKVELFPPHTHFMWGFADKPNKGSSKILDAFDKSKYGTPVGTDLPTTEDEKRYTQWQIDHSGIKEKDWVPYHGDPAFSDELNEEIANDPPSESNDSATETLSGETGSKSSEEPPQRPQQMGPPAPSRAEQDTGRYYCQKCFERSSSCECESPRLFVPPVWELDSKGRHLKREAQATSVPAVGGLVVTGAQHDAKLEQFLKNWHPERHDDDTYVGFLRNTMSPSVATEKLKAGCSICGHNSSWRDTVYWYSDWGHVCFDCKDKTHDYIGPVSTYKSRYTEGANNVVVVKH